MVISSMASCCLAWGLSADAGALRVISSAADAVSGDDVLVQLEPPSDPQWRVMLNGRDVSQAFRRSENSASLIALVSGIKPGRNRFELRIDGTSAESLELTGHPKEGPIFSGPRQMPFICQTSMNGLGPALDRNCNAQTRIYYYYKSTAPSAVSGERSNVPDAAPDALAEGFKIYDPSKPVPADVAQTLTSDGRRVSYIVRRELGTINRAVYDIQFLHQPGSPLPTPWARQAGSWNGRLIYVFGGGCAAGYRQGTLGAMSEDPLIALGYAVATSTLNKFINLCNDEVSAETLSMVKEHFTKQYGAPAYTIGKGGSGGAVQQLLIAQNHPGLLDGIVTMGSFPDMLTTLVMPVDCALLDDAMNTSTLAWSNEQKSAVSGFATWRTCKNTWLSYARMPQIVRPDNCDPSMDRTLIYDKQRNPTGVKCDYTREWSALGRDPSTGSARRPLDNIGVQYGLLAFNSGQIDAEHFVVLNERMGGYDPDGNIITGARMEGDVVAIRNAYRNGLVLTGGGGLRDIPIIDWRTYTDDLADNHVLAGSMMIRARLLAASGTATNHVMLVLPRPELIPLWTAQGRQNLLANNAQTESRFVRSMDDWLGRIERDERFSSTAERISRNRPEDVSEGCRAADGRWIAEAASYSEPGECNRQYPPYGTPRLAAGGPVTGDVLKCALKPIDRRDYERPLSSAQLARLQAVFPVGVCDYDRPGVGQEQPKYSPTSAMPRHAVTSRRSATNAVLP